MRDTLVMKYQKVQEFCSVKTYAKNVIYLFYKFIN